MTNESRSHPDLLRRFVSTPYVFSQGSGSNRISIESNDLEVALGLRQLDIVLGQRNLPEGLLCKLIRDMSSSVDGSEMTIVSDGALRVLHMGRGTILIHDQERSELLGFISRNVKVQELVSLLIPALLGTEAKV